MLDDDNSDLLASASELQRDRLYFVAFKKNFKPKNTANTHYFTVDDDFVYENFYNDFGPLNICMLFRYCQKLNSKMTSKCHLNKKIVHYTSMNPAKRLNSAVLIGAYAIIYLNKTPEEAFRPLVAGDIPSYTRFCDASYGPSGYKISLVDCIRAVHKAQQAGFFNFDDFDAEEYEYFERVENGDFNWIVPQKFIAFCGPHQKSKVLPNGYPCHSPETYFEYFRENNVTTVIRLNAKVYHASSFEGAGFDHRDLFFIDGSTPSDLILKKFLVICESTKGAIAVHCKAGLGRTGSLIGAYIMKHYNFSALEAIAWLRLCRPGSVIGHQQQWMEDKESWLWSEGERMRRRTSAEMPVHKYGIYSLKLNGKPSVEQPRPCDNAAAETGGQLLQTHVKGISQKVDTMHLHDGGGSSDGALQSEIGNNNNIDLRNRLRFTTTTTPTACAKKSFKLDGINYHSSSNNNNNNNNNSAATTSGTSDYDDDIIADEGSHATFVVARRRKSPNLIAANHKSTATVPSAPDVNANASVASTNTTVSSSVAVQVDSACLLHAKQTTPLLSALTLAASTNTVDSSSVVSSHSQSQTGQRIRIPFFMEPPLCSEKKLRKPAIIFETAQRPTIASTVRMSQAAIDKKNTQTQGDKLNQIKAMRRHHHSRSVNVTSAPETDNALRHTRARSQPFRNNGSYINVLTTSATATSPLKHGAAADADATTSALAYNNHNNNNNNNRTISNNINHINNNNNKNNNNNHTNYNTIIKATSGSSTATTAAAAVAGSTSAITTRARSLAIYSKRMGLMSLRKAETQQQSNNVTSTTNFNNNSNNNNHNNNSNNNNIPMPTTATAAATPAAMTCVAAAHHHHHHHHHDVTTPTLSSLNKQTKTYNNTLLSSSSNMSSINESKIPIVRATATILDLEAPPAAALATSSGVGIGSAATIPPPAMRSGTRGVVVVGSHHHMTLRGRSRMRYRASNVEQNAAPPCTAVTARYYRDVSAIPTMSASASSSATASVVVVGSACGVGVGRSSSAVAPPTTATPPLDFNSNPLQYTSSSTVKQQQQQQQQQQQHELLEERLKRVPHHHHHHHHSSSSSSTTKSQNPNQNNIQNNNNNTCPLAIHSTDLENANLRSTPPTSIDTNRLSNSATPTPTTNTNADATTSTNNCSSSSNNNNNNNNSSSSSQPHHSTGSSSCCSASSATIKRNKRSLSSTRIEKDKCDEYNTKLLRKTSSSSSTTNNNNNNAVTSSSAATAAAAAATTAAAAATCAGGGGTSFKGSTISRRLACAAVASASTAAAGTLESSAATSSTSSASTSGIPTPTASAASVHHQHQAHQHGGSQYLQRSAKHMLAAEREQQQQQLSLKLRKKISY